MVKKNSLMVWEKLLMPIILIFLLDLIMGLYHFSRINIKNTIFKESTQKNLESKLKTMNTRKLTLV